jgi:hypothetical protein
MAMSRVQPVGMLVVMLLVLFAEGTAFQGNLKVSNDRSCRHGLTQLRCSHSICLGRRSLLFAAAGLAVPTTAGANADKTVSKFGRQVPPGKTESDPFTYLDSGVGFKEYKEGKGDAEVEEGSKVTVNLVGRLLNLNGVKFYSTKERTDEFGEGRPLTFTIGAGEALPGLEQGMMGMKRGAVRKVCIAWLHFTRFTCQNATNIVVPCSESHDMHAKYALTPLTRLKSICANLSPQTKHALCPSCRNLLSNDTNQRPGACWVNFVSARFWCRQSLDTQQETTFCRNPLRDRDRVVQRSTRCSRTPVATPPSSSKSGLNPSSESSTLILHLCYL